MQILSGSMASRFAKRLIGGVACIAIAAGVCRADVSPVGLTETFKQRLTERLVAGPAKAQVRAVPMTTKLVREVVQKNLAGNLLTSVRDVGGTDFRFVPSGEQDEVQVAMLTLTYADDETAKRMARHLLVRKAYFRNTKILTRFCHVPAGHQLTIVFTENSGNEAVVKFVDDCQAVVKAG